LSQHAASVVRKVVMEADMGYGVLYMYLDLIFFIHIAGLESTCLI
jgi:hypothetical protein